MADVLELTDQQRARAEALADEWLAASLSTERCDRPAAEAAVRAAYRAADLEFPALVVWMDSPEGGCFAARVLDAVHLPQRPRYLKDRLWGWPADQLWTMPDGLVRGPLRALFDGRLLGPVRGSLHEPLEAWCREEIGYEPFDGGCPRWWDQIRSQLDGLSPDMADHPGVASPDGLLWHLGGQFWNGISPWYGPHLLARHRMARELAGQPPSEALDTLAEAVRQVGWWWPTADAVVLTDRPTVLRRDAAGRLHADDGPALAYADDFRLHVQHGRLP